MSATKTAFGSYKDLLEARDKRDRPPAADSHSERVSAFVEFATWDHQVHGKGDHRMADRAAQRLLAQDTMLARHDLFTAIVCGDLDEVMRVLADQPLAARERGGPRNWTPLLYLCYTRFSHPPAIENAVAIATALLDRGANPNDYYMAGHGRYSTLVGVAREGEQDAPRHPRREELFALLLERGANMYDIQVLYNTHFSGDVLWWLKLVHSRAVLLGRKTDWDDPDWPMFDMGGRGSGANPNASPPTDPRLSKRSLYEDALREGVTGIADLLQQYGATPGAKELDDEESFVAACLRLESRCVRELVQSHPEYLTSPAAMFEAAKRNRTDVLQCLVDLGVSIDVRDAFNTRPLHHAASQNALRAALFLIERGAEIDPRESQFDAPPIGWAAHGDHREMVDFLSQYSRNVWTLSFGGYVDRLRAILRDDPSLAQVTSVNG